MMHRLLTFATCLAIIGFGLVATSGLSSGQMLQAIVGGGTFSAPASYVGIGDVSGGGSIDLYYGAAAMSAAEAAATPDAYDYSCAGGSPATGTVKIKTTGYADQAIFTGACNGLSVQITKVYARSQTGYTCAGGTTANCNLDDLVDNSSYSSPYPDITAVANLANGHTCFSFAATAGETRIRSDNPVSSSVQPQGMSVVMSQSGTAVAVRPFRPDTANDSPSIITNSGSGGTGGAAIYSGAYLTPSPAAPFDGTLFAFNAGISGTTSNIQWQNGSTSGSVAGNAGTTSTTTGGARNWPIGRYDYRGWNDNHLRGSILEQQHVMEQHEFLHN